MQRAIEDTVWRFAQTSTPKCQQHEIILSAYPPNRRLCIVTYMAAYLDCTAPLRQGERKLLFSDRVPHSHCLRDTVRRWTKRVMKEAGIDLEIFTPHSTWAASTSKVDWKILLKTTLQTTEYLCHVLPQTSVEKDWFSLLQCYSKIGTGN